MDQVIVRLAQATTTSSCTVNGEPCTADQAAGLGIFFLVFAVFGLAFFVVWVITLIHLIKHEDVPNRTLWLVLHFIGAPFLASLIYFFVVKRPYDKAHAGSAPVAPAAPQPPVEAPKS